MIRAERHQHLMDWPIWASGDSRLRRPSRRLRQAKRRRRGIPFAVTLPPTMRLTKPDADILLCRIRDTQRRGDPLILGNGVTITPLECR